jgi:hypothetical protein
MSYKSAEPPLSSQQPSHVIYFLAGSQALTDTPDIVIETQLQDAVHRNFTDAILRRSLRANDQWMVVL